MKFKKIFTKTLAFELRKLGYRIIKVEPNYNSPECDVWTFVVEGDFLADFARLSQEIKRQ